MSLELPFCNVNKTTDRITTTSDMKVGRSYYCFKIKNETRTCFIRYITWLILNATYFLADGQLFTGFFTRESGVHSLKILNDNFAKP